MSPFQGFKWAHALGYNPKNNKWEEGEDEKTQPFPVLEHRSLHCLCRCFHTHTDESEKKKMVVCFFCSVGPEVFHQCKKEAENADFSKVLHKVHFLIRKKKQIKKFGESKKKKARRANKK